MGKILSRSWLACLLFSLAMSLPYYLVDLEPITRKCVVLIVDLLIIMYYYYFLKSQGGFEKSAQEPNWKNLLVLSPVIFGLLSFPFFSLTMPEGLYIVQFDSINFFLDLLTALCVAVLDEMFFRMYWFGIVRQYFKKKWQRILVCAGVVALFEAIPLVLTLQIINIASSVLYLFEIFLVAFILAVIVEYGHCNYVSVIYYFIYVFIYEYYLGGTMFHYIGQGYYFKILFVVVAAVYLVIIYFVKYKKKEDEFYVW